MKLSIHDRLLILNLDTLPAIGNIITLKIKQQLLSDCGFNEQELKDFNIRQEDQSIKWDIGETSNIYKEVEMGDMGKKVLIEALEKSENLNDGYISLYDRLKNEQSY